MSMRDARVVLGAPPAPPVEMRVNRLELSPGQVRIIVADDLGASYRFVLRGDEANTVLSQLNNGDFSGTPLTHRILSYLVSSGRLDGTVDISPPPPPPPAEG